MFLQNLHSCRDGYKSRVKTPRSPGHSLGCDQGHSPKATQDNHQHPAVPNKVLRRCDCDSSPCTGYVIPASLWAACLVPFCHLRHSVSLDTVGAVLRPPTLHHPPVAASVTEANGDSIVAGSWQSCSFFLTHFICSSLGCGTWSMGPLGKPLILWTAPHPLEETGPHSVSEDQSSPKSLGKGRGCVWLR